MVLSFRVSLFCFCDNFSVNAITATSTVCSLFFQWLKYAFYFFCRFLPCTFILVRRGCEESAFNAAQQNPHAFSGKNTIRDVEAVTRSRKLICFLVFTGHIHKLFPLLYVFVPFMACVKKTIKGQN